MTDSVIEPRQLTLGLNLSDEATFHNFLVSPANAQITNYLHSSADDLAGQFIYLWGGDACGKTHLLQALCHEFSRINKASIYIPMGSASEYPPSVLEGADTLGLVCLDDVDEIAGNKQWEDGLFHSFNELRESKTCLLASGNSAPQDLAIELPDLHSRLQSGLVFQVAELDDIEKRNALQLRAQNRGMDLSDAVADFIISRAQRSLVSLMEILDRLDESSLEEKRGLSIPLVKSTLGW